LITGFNTDIKHNEKVYHIQTEDKGLQNPYIESLVYVGGEISNLEIANRALALKQVADAVTSDVGGRNPFAGRGN